MAAGTGRNPADCARIRVRYQCARFNLEHENIKREHFTKRLRGIDK